MHFLVGLLLANMVCRVDGSKYVGDVHVQGSSVLEGTEETSYGPVLGAVRNVVESEFWMLPVLVGVLRNMLLDSEAWVLRNMPVMVICWRFEAFRARRCQRGGDGQ